MKDENRKDLPIINIVQRKMAAGDKATMCLYSFVLGMCFIAFIMGLADNALRAVDWLQLAAVTVIAIVWIVISWRSDR